MVIYYNGKLCNVRGIPVCYRINSNALFPYTVSESGGRFKLPRHQIYKYTRPAKNKSNLYVVNWDILYSTNSPWGINNLLQNENWETLTPRKLCGYELDPNVFSFHDDENISPIGRA